MYININLICFLIDLPFLGTTLVSVGQITC